MLPEGWVCGRLRDIAKVEWGNTSLTKKSYVAAGVPAFSAAGQDGFVREAGWHGDAVVLSAIGARCGKCFMASGDWTAIKNTIVIQPRDSAIDIKYLFHFLNDEKRWPIGGSSQPFITMGGAQEVEVPLSPPSEQRRIVERVEALLAVVHNATQRFDRVPLILKRFRQAVLAAACSGRLVAPVLSAEVADDELARVRDEVVQRRREDPRTRRRRFSTPNVPEALTSELPSHWARCRIGDVFDISYGLSEPLRKTSPETAGDVPVLSMANITPWGEWNLSTLKFFEVAPSDLRKLALRTGDLLFNWRNSPNWIGKTARFDLRDRLYVNASFLLRLRPSRSGTYERFFQLYLNHLRLSGYFENASRAAVSQSNFNASEVGVIEAPFPPLHEQAEIVRQVDDLFALAHRIEHRVQVANARATKLTQTILSKAFSGKLVPTDAELSRAKGRTFETAGELLARLQSAADDHHQQGSGIRRALKRTPINGGRGKAR